MENSDINYTKIEINCATNTIVEAPMSETEIAEYEADQAAQALKIAEAQAKAEAKVVAQAKLTALGLTVSDLEALGL
jgi:hypothetical protein